MGRVVCRAALSSGCAGPGLSFRIAPDAHIEAFLTPKMAATEGLSAEGHGALEENAERNPMRIHGEVLTLGFGYGGHVTDQPSSLQFLH